MKAAGVLAFGIHFHTLKVFLPFHFTNNKGEKKFTKPCTHYLWIYVVNLIGKLCMSF